MAYVINEGDKATEYFSEFIELCCSAYNIVRRNYQTFFNLMLLMLNAGIEELQKSDDVRPMAQALRLEMTDDEAIAHFKKVRSCVAVVTLLTVALARLSRLSGCVGKALTVVLFLRCR